MEKMDYGVVILNYKTAEDAVEAAKSVIENAEGNRYRICIVDGNSNEGRDVLERSSLPNTDLLFLNTNRGYAYGNNKGIQFLAERYDMKYIVIMNPDVLIIEKSTIEDIIKAIQGKEQCIGGQPLIWNPILGDEADSQINVTRVFSYFDYLVESFILFKFVFQKRYKKNIYYEKMPYKESFLYEVPSGAFFVIDYKFFESICFFDERTFLYGEERILGFKVKKEKKSFILVPGHMVMHALGKSIASNPKKVTKKAFAESKKSSVIYLQYYLKVGKVKTIILLIFKEINYLLKQIKYFLGHYI